VYYKGHFEKQQLQYIGVEQNKKNQKAQNHVGNFPYLVLFNTI
jgi:hypothetical protein